MNGAIFYQSKYSSTANYAQWIGEATGLPVFDVTNPGADPSDYDFLVLGSPILYFKLLFRKWVHRNAAAITSRPTILFSVSGAGPGPKLDSWLAKCLPEDVVAHVHHVGLRGRSNHDDLGWFDWLMLLVWGMMNPDRKSARDEQHGFDYMDKSSIQPIVEMIAKLQKGETIP
ncbi:flavodoxin domain-containing protein [Arenibacterium sp. CAU 1754]